MTSSVNYSLILGSGSIQEKPKTLIAKEGEMEEEEEEEKEQVEVQF